MDENCSTESSDRNGIPIPEGWAVYYDGELVFSADAGHWRGIGPAIEQIMGQS